jgi:hypothetical protein
MAIDKINTYANDDTNILAVQTTADQLIINRTSVSLTNMTDTTLPIVAAGSYFDCGGTLYKVGTNTTPSGTPTDNATCYIMATPAVDGLTATLSFTNTAPTWNDSKQGWYGTSGNAGNVYLPFEIYRASTVYNKRNASFKYNYFGDYLLASKADSQSFSQSNNTLVAWSTVYDPNGCFSSNVFTAKHSGIYSINAMFVFNGATVSSGGDTLFTVRKNGTVYATSENLSSAYMSLNICTEISLNVGDTIDFYLSAAGGAQERHDAARASTMSIRAVR